MGDIIDCNYTVVGSKVIATPKQPLPAGKSIKAKLTTAVRGKNNERMQSDYEWQFKTETSNKDILFWSCDNDGTKPVIDPVRDYNPYGLTLNFEEMTVTEALQVNGRIIGNGCLQFNNSVFPLKNGRINLGDTIRKAVTKEKMSWRMGFWIMPTLLDGSIWIMYAPYGNGGLKLDKVDSNNAKFELYTMNITDMPPISINKWVYIEMRYKWTVEYQHQWQMRINGESWSQNYNVNYDLYVNKDYWMFSMHDSWRNCHFIDNVHLTFDYDKDLYKFRGIDHYMTELVEPPVPAYDIKFWLTGDKDNYSNLIRQAHYPTIEYKDGGKDYTSGKFGIYHPLDKPVKDFVSSEHPSNIPSKGSILLADTNNMYNGISFHGVSGLEGFSLSGTMGVWFKLAPNDNNILLNLEASTADGNNWINLLYTNKAFILTVRTPSTYNCIVCNKVVPDGWHFVQGIWKPNTNTTWKILLDGVNLPVTDGIWRENFNFIPTTIEIERQQFDKDTNCQNLIFSSNPNLDMWIKRPELGNKAICELTEYPR